MSAPAGTEVGLYVDLQADVIPGHIIETTSSRAYLVVAARRQARGKHVGRQHLRCIVLPADHNITTRAHVIRWHRRARRRPEA